MIVETILQNEIKHFHPFQLVINIQREEEALSLLALLGVSTAVFEDLIMSAGYKDRVDIKKADGEMSYLWEKIEEELSRQGIIQELH